MTATLLDRPAAHGAGGGVPARRAMLRWAWRLFRREWRQQALVLALIAAAVAATVVGAGVATNTPPPAGAGFGTAGVRVTLPGSDPHLAADVAAIGRRFGGDEVIATATAATGLVHGTTVRAQDPAGRFGRPMLGLVAGRYPHGTAEVALTRSLAAALDLRIGDIDRATGTARRVVGLVENPQNLLDEFALVAPGQVARPDHVTVLFDGSAAAVTLFPFPAGTRPQHPGDSVGLSPAVVVLVLAVLGLVFVGLVAVAGFSVLAQRRLRALAMISSLGATDRNVGLVVVANGAAVGAVGAFAGAAVGLAGWAAYAPHLVTATHHRFAWTHLPWWLVVTAVLLAVGTATLAARRPARAVVRIPVVAALSGRPAPPRPVHRSALPGAGLLAAGAGLLAASGGWGGGSGKAPYLLVGLLAVSAGLLLLASPALAALPVVAGRVPVAGRIALRDLVRYRARSGAALAATSFAVFIAVVVSLIATGRYSDAVDYFGPNLPANEVVASPPELGPGKLVVPIGPRGPVPPPVAVPRPTAQQTAVWGAAARDIAATVPGGTVLPLVSPDVALTQQPQRRDAGTLYVATPDLLRHYGIAAGAIDPTALVVTSRPGLAATRGLTLAGHSLVTRPKVQTLRGLPTDTAEPNLLVTPYAVRTLHLGTAPAAWLIQTPRALTAQQRNAVRQAAAATGLTVETKKQNPSLDQLRNYATGTGILLALGVLAITVGLIRAETTGDLRVLAATGASRWTRRTLAASTAGALGLLAGVLGTAVAYLTTAAFFRSQLSERMAHVPVLDLLLVLVGLPVAAAVGGWVFAGREPAALGSRPLE